MNAKIKKFKGFFFSLILFLPLLSLAFANDFEAEYKTAILSLPTSLDPSEAIDTSSSMVVLQIYETLFIRDLKGNITPGLVQDYKVSPERDIYIFNLRENIKFHDDSIITSSDVVFSLSRRIKKYIGTLDIIKGAKEFKQGKSKTIEGIKIINQKTFEIKLNNPFANFPEVLSDVTLSIIPINFEKNMMKNQYIGSGAYKLVNLSKNQINLKFFNGYYQKPPSIKNVSFVVVQNEDDAKKLSNEGKLDNTHPFEIDFSNLKNWTDYYFLSASTQFILLNPSNKKFKNIETRKSLLSLIPFEKFYKELDPDAKHVVSHFIPLGLPGYIPEKWVPPYSEAYSLKKLKEAHFTDPIVITNYLPQTKYRNVANEICNIWNSHKIPCVTNNVSLDQAMSIIKSNKHEVLIGKFVPDIPETSNLLSFFKSNHHLPLFNLKDSKIDELLDSAFKTPSGQMRTDYYKVINRLIYDHFAVVPLQYGGRKRFFITNIFKMPELDVTGPYSLKMQNLSYSNQSK